MFSMYVFRMNFLKLSVNLRENSKFTILLMYPVLVFLLCWPVFVPQIVGGFRPVGPVMSNESRQAPVSAVFSAMSNIVKSNL